MAVSCNEDVRVGNVVFHVQTEYYRRSGKVVANIFRNGVAVKRLEKQLSNMSDIDSEVLEFHRFVVDRIKNRLEK